MYEKNPVLCSSTNTTFRDRVLKRRPQYLNREHRLAKAISGSVEIEKGEAWVIFSNLFVAVNNSSSSWTAVNCSEIEIRETTVTTAAILITSAPSVTDVK